MTFEKYPVCEKTFKSDKFEAHLRQHTGETPFKCLWCDKAFKRITSLLDHLRRHTGEKPYFCHKCPTSFPDHGGLIKHIVYKHDDYRNRHKCKICQKSCRSDAELIIHIRVHTGEKPFKCSVCGRSFAQKSTLNGHSTIHLGIKPFSCELCSKTFRTKCALSNHNIGVHSEARPFSCEICGKSYPTKIRRDEHTASHLNERPFKCPNCEKRFAREQTLRYHVKAVHDKRRDFKCSQCPSAYVDMQHLKCHLLRKHSKPHEKPLACVFCTKTFCDDSQFMYHLQGHILEKPYFCDKCPASLANKWNLEKHLRVIHNIDLKNSI